MAKAGMIEQTTANHDISCNGAFTPRGLYTKKISRAGYVSERRIFNSRVYCLDKYSACGGVAYHEVIDHKSLAAVANIVNQDFIRHAIVIIGKVVTVKRVKIDRIRRYLD